MAVWNCEKCGFEKEEDGADSLSGLRKEREKWFAKNSGAYTKFTLYSEPANHTGLGVTFSK